MTTTDFVIEVTPLVDSYRVDSVDSTRLVSVRSCVQSRFAVSVRSFGSQFRFGSRLGGYDNIIGRRPGPAGRPSGGPPAMWGLSA